MTLVGVTKDVSAVQEREAMSSAPEPAVDISMFDDHLVIRRPDQLDIHLTLVLVDAVAAALRGGSTVMIDLDPETESGDLVAIGPSAGADPVTPIDGTAASVLGPGCVSVSTGESLWTIDLSRSRLFRSDTAVDPAFVAADDWMSVRAVWLTCTSITALSVDGRYVSARPNWSVEH